MRGRRVRACVRAARVCVMPPGEMPPVNAKRGRANVDEEESTTVLCDASVAPSRGTLAASGCAEVRGGPAIHALHSWPRGGFGELTHDHKEPDGSAPRGPASRTPEVCTLLLNSREAYYLAFGLETPRLIIYQDDVLLTRDACWATFCAADEFFPSIYTAYCSLRAAGWHIRDGIKFGVDFTLYEPSSGPSAHATHSVLVLPPGAGERNWLWLQRHVRLSHTVGKQLLLCTIEAAGGNEAELLSTPVGISQLEVRTLAVSTWGANREHGLQSLP